MGGLSERLRGETEALHRSAERSRFMGALLRGRMDRPAYCALLLNLHAVYAVLEPALMRHAQHPLIAPVFLPGLWRSAALAADLGALQGSSWAVAGELQSACLRYVQRLCEVDATQHLATAQVAEAVLAFELHRSLFDELAVACSVSD
jgi:heme oxygenase (biliverdin-producing, ferredoxin)